jgi:hypothetical protein
LNRGLDLIPHGASDLRYKDILSGKFQVRVRALPAMEYDVDDGMVDDGSEIVAGNPPAEPFADVGELADDFLDSELLRELEEALFEGVEDPPFDEDGDNVDGGGGDGGAFPPDNPPPPAPALPSPSAVLALVAVDAVPPPPAPLAQQSPLGASLRRGRWGVFTVTPKSNGWQARCVFHRFHQRLNNKHYPNRHAQVTKFAGLLFVPCCIHFYIYVLCLYPLCMSTPIHRHPCSMPRPSYVQLVCLASLNYVVMYFVNVSFSVLCLLPGSTPRVIARSFSRLPGQIKRTRTRL